MTPLLDAGRMPNLSSLIERGVMGNLASLQPMLSPMLWNSIATGKRPHKHGIHGFVEPDPDGTGIRPMSSRRRTAKALWNIFTQTGRTSNVVGWFCSHPAEPIDGAFVSEHYGKAGRRRQDWKLSPGTIHPPELAEELGRFRVHPTEIDLGSLTAFVPRAAEINQEEDDRLSRIATQLAECASVHASATWLMENRPADLTAVYFNTIDHLSHLCMQFHPPRRRGLSPESFELYKDVVNQTYVYQDLQLGRLVELAGEDATIIVCSDHGFHSDHMRPTWTPRLNRAGGLASPAGDVGDGGAGHPQG